SSVVDDGVPDVEAAPTTGEGIDAPFLGGRNRFERREEEAFRGGTENKPLGDQSGATGVQRIPGPRYHRRPVNPLPPPIAGWRPGLQAVGEGLVIVCADTEADTTEPAIL